MDNTPFLQESLFTMDPMPADPAAVNDSSGSIDFSSLSAMLSMQQQPQQECVSFTLPASAISGSSSSASAMPPMMFLSQPQQQLPQQQQQQQQQQLQKSSLLQLPRAETMGVSPSNDAATHGCHLKFPYKLFDLISDAERCGFTHIISWIPTGDGFRVHNHAAFAKEIMPKYFGMSHYKSFQRQLSLYSFKRATEGLNRDAYQHPCFLKANRHLCSFIPREKKRPVKGTHRIDLRNSNSNPCILNLSPSVTGMDPAPISHPQQQQHGKVSSQIPIDHSAPSSWVKEHNHWLSQYVHFLVHGHDSSYSNIVTKGMNEATLCAMSAANNKNPATASIEGAFVPNLEDLEHVTLEDVCEEIVLTFGHTHRDGAENFLDEV